MSFTHKITRRYETEGELIEQTKVITADGEDNRDPVIPDSTTDQLVNMTIDISQLKSIYISTDNTVTLETNNATTPIDTLTITPDQPVDWQVGDVHSNPFSADVTAIYLTNNSGSVANVKIRKLEDSTP